MIVDLAAEQGGNCELTKPNETIQVAGVTIIGAVNLPATVPFHASQMLSRNVLTLLQHLIKDNALTIDLADEITKAKEVTLREKLARARARQAACKADEQQPTLW